MPLLSEPLPVFVVGAALGALVIWLWSRSRVALLSDRLERSTENLQALQTRLAENEQLKIEIATLEAQRAADTERLSWIYTADEQLSSSFRALAGEVLEQSSHRLTDRSSEQMRHLVAPLEKTLQELGSQVREIEKDRRGAYDALEREIHLLRDAHGALQSTAVGLRQALESSSVRGRWGEVQLRRVVEMAGLVEHVDFTEQPTVEGLRPDMIVHLSHGGVLPVDAKAPMTAFLKAAESEDATLRRTHLEAHLKALRQRTLELGQKRYWSQFTNAPDFVVMFVPNEASLGGAFERDPEFLDFALRHRVLPATPVTLLALLKSVAYGWSQHRVAENARQIASSGRELHQRLIRFLDHLRQLGSTLEGASRAYNQAVGSLERRVLPSARRLADAGAMVDELPEITPNEQKVRPPRRASEPSLGNTTELEPVRPDPATGS